MKHEGNNPWMGVHTGREFLYDVTHPRQFFRRAHEGMVEAIRELRELMR